MTGEVKPVTVKILDKEYLVSCRDDERDQLHAAVSFLNERMLEVKNSGKVVGSERVAVMAALNIAHLLLACQRQNADYSSSIDTTIRRLHSKIDEALMTRSQQVGM